MSSLTQIDEAQASRIRHTIWFALIGIVVVWFGSVPALGGNLSLYFSLMLWVTMATAFNIIAGFTGYMPFGYVAFYGAGTYASAILIVNYDITPYLAIPAAGLAGAALALIFAPTLRLGGIYFAIVSLSLAVIMQRVAGLAPDEITGGSHGLNLGHKTEREEGYYAMLLVLVMALTTVTWLARSRLGKALKAIRDDAVAADAMGIDIQRSRLYAWMMSAAFASLCGGVQAWFTGALDPITAFDIIVTAKTVIYAMAGGLATVTGPVVGTVILVWVDELIWREFPILNTFLLGLIIALLILFMPRGIVGTLMQRFPRMRRLIM